MSDEPRLLCEGRHLRFLTRDGWEYVEHRTAPEAAMIVAITRERRLVLVEEFRPPLSRPVISLPTGLIGDEGPEEAEEAARRELREETGYEAPGLERLARGPGSAGQSSEMVTFFLAVDAELVGEQARQDRERIRAHAVPVDEVLEWTAGAERAGKAIDPKIYAGLYLAEGFTRSLADRRPRP